ncbi:MAG: DedA family protein [Deltaproteobacteria bacterium HGW-Deltaproteobacteria-13]|jgi:membrane protein DedA with SNARE-associated domain|nr:MAG: DedA family protein [Deltaproteobacteria bacterium HGW-Deltaproteobacteria-13]
MHSLLPYIAQYSYWGIFFSLGLGILGLPIPDETLMVFAGFQIFQGHLNYPLAVVIAFLGTSCGITSGYFIGRLSDKFLLKKYSDKLHINPEHFENAEQFYRNYGKSALLIGYFIPGVRHLTAIFAGISRMPYRTFAVYAYTGGFFWTILFINLGYFLGDGWHRFDHYSNRFIIPLAAVALVVTIVVMYLKQNKKNNQH